ncbi:hypothetical protein HUG10_21295 (plasmid) [Halorarum halophilum]|uniref:Uncharacterized protein n=1 Tax=Halorarum halophilum TaxID=2743090 RepID=A0A7D5GEX7_9EURY|nr:hypothetical protein [Halobaculum halophilum]QLG30125.1 hypothetical protein HUG10_21295 [Halobaculum halophilum]
MELVVTAYGQSPKLVTKPDSLVRDGYAADAWVLCTQLLGQRDDEMLVQLRNDEGDNWLVDEKGLKSAVLQQDCVYLTVGHRTDNAILVDQFGVGTPSGVSMRYPVGDLWLPKSQITMFEPKTPSTDSDRAGATTTE